MITDDFTPQEVCVYLKLCDPQMNVGSSVTSFPVDKKGEISKTFLSPIFILIIYLLLVYF
jgi:hypothetical protein